MNVSNPLAPGENGAAFVPSEDEKEVINKQMAEQNYNIYASDRISLRRSLPDYRFPQCQYISYPNKLPTTSVIIVVHNEIWSTLLRTVWSVIDRSPREMIEEIILVDDASTKIYLQRPLEDYVATLPVTVKVLRTGKREGLIRARLIGAKQAKVPVKMDFFSIMQL